MQTVLYLLGAGVTGFGALATTLMSPAPTHWASHLCSLARLGVFAACASGVARVLQDGLSPSWESIVMVCALAVLYLLQVRKEAIRQQSNAGTLA